ncbi:MAG TPA: T9SS type A sorting domain-containing protein [Bacteroidales bacterium]|jgi:hypothetical protein|nr:T9SS type A sorting domain-containing protein [Bacteroidales bacterium]HNY44440.1 T9SS type A sorting domain-containing protein [Bacteroidales bacterium]
MKKFILIILSFLIAVFAYSQFPRDQKIVTAEYFINIDPGEGNGIAINLGGTPLWEVTVNVPNIQLAVGSKIYIRFKSTNGKWSAPRSIKRKPYFENRGSTLEYGEYFINSDPGQGNGQQVSFQNGIANIYGLNIKRGDKIYVRIRDNLNRWSLSRPVTFNFKEIIKAEYYIKYGSGGSSNPQLMNLSPYNEYSCVYTAIDNDIPKNNFDTAFIRFQTKDKFYSQWAKRRMDNVGIDELSINKYKLANYPNPFSQVTTISFSIPETAHVTLKIIGILGTYNTEIVSEKKSAGKYEIKFDASKLPEGMYYCQLYVNNQTSSIKLIVHR